MPVFPRNVSSQRQYLCAVLGCAIGAAVLLSAIPARAQEETPEGKILDAIMTSIGLTKGKETIEYRERSPLVIPPGSALPPPQTDRVANPNWPVDPEVKEAKALAAANKDDGRTSSQRMDDAMRPMLRSDLEKGRTNRRQNNPRGDESGMSPSSWSDLGYRGGLFGNMFGSQKENEGARFTGETPRTSLIAPPPGYQTPSPNQPYALGKSTYRDKPIDYYNDRKYEK